MLPFKKIVCPTDFSDPSYQAVKAASELALHFSADLILVHVVTPVQVIPTPNPPAGFNLPSYAQEMESLAKKTLEEVVRDHVPSELKARTVVVHGSAADEIVATATNEKADLIVMPTHGQTGWRRIMFGSVAEKVLRLATCPLLTIHGPKEKE